MEIVFFESIWSLLVAKAAAESVYSGVGERRGIAKAGWNLEQFRAVLVRMAGRRECSR